MYCNNYICTLSVLCSRCILLIIDFYVIFVVTVSCVWISRKLTEAVWKDLRTFLQCEITLKITNDTPETPL